MSASATSVVGLVLVDRLNRLLLERRPDDAKCYPALWDTPGGKVEPGELPSGALVREMDEELGIVPQNVRLLGVFEDRDPSSGRLFRHYAFLCRDVFAAPVARLGQTLQWVPLAQLNTLQGLNPIVQTCIDAIPPNELHAIATENRVGA